MGGVIVRITGDATAAGSITLGDDSRVDGILTEYGMPATFTPVECPPVTPFTAGGADVKKRNGKRTTLAPGSYGALKLGTLNRLYLSSGDYFFDSIRVGNRLRLYLDVSAGPINIFVVGDVKFGTNMNVFLTGGSPSDVYAETHGTWTMYGGSDWKGSIFAPYGNIQVHGGNNRIKGALWSCKNVILDSNVRVRYIPPPID